MTAIASPYRAAETPLMTRERILEQDVAHARGMLDAFCNEEVRIERKVLVGEAPREELAHVRNTLHEWELAVMRLTSELEHVRREIIQRGERREVAQAPADAVPLWPLWIGPLFLAMVVIAGVLRTTDTAEASPRGATFGWGGPLDPGQTWLYVEGPRGARFEVDGRSYLTPNRVPVSALHSHDVAFEGGGKVVVRWIPCTTAVVRSADTKAPSVERFFNSATCF